MMLTICSFFSVHLFCLRGYCRGCRSMGGIHRRSSGSSSSNPRPPKPEKQTNATPQRERAAIICFVEDVESKQNNTKCRQTAGETISVPSRFRPPARINFLAPNTYFTSPRQKWTLRRGWAFFCTFYFNVPLSARVLCVYLSFRFLHFTFSAHF